MPKSAKYKEAPTQKRFSWFIEKFYDLNWNAEEMGKKHEQKRRQKERYWIYAAATSTIVAAKWMRWTFVSTPSKWVAKMMIGSNTRAIKIHETINLECCSIRSTTINSVYSFIFFSCWSQVFFFFFILIQRSAVRLTGCAKQTSVIASDEAKTGEEIAEGKREEDSKRKRKKVRNPPLPHSIQMIDQIVKIWSN